MKMLFNFPENTSMERIASNRNQQILKNLHIFFLLVAERLTKISGSAAFFDWVGGAISAVGLCPGIKIRGASIVFLSGVKGFYPLQAVCGYPQTLLADMLRTLFLLSISFSSCIVRLMDV